MLSRRYIVGGHAALAFQSLHADSSTVAPVKHVVSNSLLEYRSEGMIRD